MWRRRIRFFFFVTCSIVDERFRSITQVFSKLVLWNDKVWFMVIYFKDRGNYLVRIICFDFVEKGGATCCRLVASVHYIGIFNIEFTSIFELLEVCWGLSCNQQFWLSLDDLNFSEKHYILIFMKYIYERDIFKRLK